MLDILGLMFDVAGFLQGSDTQAYQPWITFELFFLLLDTLILVSAVMCAFLAQNKVVRLTARAYCVLLLVLFILSVISSFL